MPTYQYECTQCGHSFEIIQAITERRLSKCPQCGKRKLVRLIGSGSGIIFKGNGFYETDYKRKESPSKKDQKEISQEKKTEQPPSPKASGGNCCGSSCGCCS